MSTSTSKLSIEVISTERLHASNKPKCVQHAPLSILDANVLDFSAAQLVFLYDAIPNKDTKSLMENLKTSLQAMLAFYPQWCGRLRFSDYDPKSTNHLNRYGRLVLSYGGDQEPGVEFVVARTAAKLSSIVPSPDERANLKTWDATDLPRTELIPATVLAPDLENPNAPTVIAQVTEFGCGGFSVDLKIPHPLADGLTYSRFVHGWAVLARGESISSVPEATFDPQRVDRAAEGDIDCNHADRTISRRARRLPWHRYDWWISADDCPFPSPSAQVPRALQNQKHDEPGVRIPWSEWDTAAPMKILILHFTDTEIKAIHSFATEIDRRVSKQDALMCHLWSCINRARGLSSTDEPVYLNYALGMRARISPPLDESFVGSPFLLASTSTTGRQACKNDSLPILAARLRATLARFTSDSVAAYIHDRIYDQSPQRLWQTFLGRCHVLSTSVVNLKFPELDFGFGMPRYTESIMPPFDGLVGLMEGQPKQKSNKNTHWSEGGMDCQVHLPVATAMKLVQDPMLHRFAEQGIQSRL